MYEITRNVLAEVKKAIVGKDDVISKVWIALLAEGHVLLEDVPGVGKTTMALAFSRALGLDTKRIQFTPDTMPSDIIGFSLPEQARQAKACVGYLPEQPPLYPEMTVQEYLDFTAELKGVKKAQRREQVQQAARRTGLDQVMPRLIRSLSKGYRQRVGIAQALLGSPQLIILDEPTVGLDPAQVIGIRKLIRELGKTHTVILSSHILSEVQAVCSRVLILSKGTLVAEGTPEQLSEKLSPGIRLRVTALGSSDTVLPVVEAVPGITGVQLVSEADGEVTFTAETADTTDRRAEVSHALSEAGCTVLELTAENRSLEEVFLALTGETADVPEEPETEPKGE